MLFVIVLCCLLPIQLLASVDSCVDTLVAQLERKTLQGDVAQRLNQYLEGKQAIRYYGHRDPLKKLRLRTFQQVVDLVKQFGPFSNQSRIDQLLECKEQIIKSCAGLCRTQGQNCVQSPKPVSYTHLTLPTKRIV